MLSIVCVFLFTTLKGEILYIYAPAKEQAMIRKIYALALLICFVSLHTFAQTAVVKELPAAQRKLDALKGTYELLSNTREMAMLPSNLADIIEQNRKDSELTTMQLNGNLTLIIYPRNQVTRQIPAVKK
jgi:hypothetical protein